MPEVTGIPLIVRMPGGAGHGTKNSVDHDLTDLVPSLCQYMGWQVPADLPGDATLLPAGDEPQTVGSTTGKPAVLENRLYGEDQQAVRAWPFYGLDNDDGSTPVWFDLAKDPTAREPLGDAPAEGDTIWAAAHARQDVWDELSTTFTRTPADSATLDDTLRRQLRSLGY